MSTAVVTTARVATARVATARVSTARVSTARVSTARVSTAPIAAARTMRGGAPASIASSSAPAIIACSSAPASIARSSSSSSSSSSSTAPVQPRLRLTRRGRFVFASLVAFPLAIVAGVFALNGGVAIASGATSSATFEYVQVESGQSLWQLAAAIAPDADPREVVSDIVHLNQLPSADVQPGQQLAVPATYSE